MSPTIELAIELISRPSLTPHDAGCQDLIISRLEPLGFNCERLVFGDVTNLWARRGKQGPVLCLAGHTDVVPTGSAASWQSPPFQPEISAGMLYGRGAADMKGGLAAMITAVTNFVTAIPEHQGSIAILLTSDEEGAAVDGTVRVVELLQSRGEFIDWCLFAEPTSTTRVADTCKNGRRGSLSGRLRVIGKQGHVAHPQQAKNPLHACIATLAKLCTETWDQGNEHFPPTGFQISNLHMGTGAENVIPAELTVWFNLRFGTALTPDIIKKRITTILEQGGFEYALDWTLSGMPFLTLPDTIGVVSSPTDNMGGKRVAYPGNLIDAVRQSVLNTTGYVPVLSTSGGTSDGRFVAPTGAQVVELGPNSATIHQVNECVAVTELETLTQIYQRLLERLLGN